MNTSSDGATLLRSRARSYAAVAIVLSIAATLLAVQTGFISLSNRPWRDVVILLGAFQLAFYVWVRVFSHLRTRSQWMTLAIFVAIQAAAYAMVRHDGFAGDGRLILAWRWTPTPEQLFASSRPQVRAAPEADLSRTTADDSPAFRGRDRDGRVHTVELETDWESFPPRQLWRQPVGLAWSSFAVVGDYAVTQEQRGDDEAVVCYELRTGREVWEWRDAARFVEVTSGLGPRATPAIHDGQVYSLGATGILNCLDGRDGRRIWSVDILHDNGVENRIFGMVGSPLISGSMVVVCPGGAGSSLAAYDLRTGESVWKGGDADASYSSPHAARLCGREQIFAFNADGIFGHEARTGEVLWSFPWISNPAERNNVCQPVAVRLPDGSETDHVFIASGYGMGCALLKLDEAGGRFSVTPRWRNRNLKAKFSSVVLHEGCLYGFDGAILTCLDVATGERRWKRGHYGYGQLIVAGSMLVVQLESGEIALVAASPDKHRELARFAALDDRTWNHPVLSRRLLVVRNDREAACYELPTKAVGVAR